MNGDPKRLDTDILEDLQKAFSKPEEVTYYTIEQADRGGFAGGWPSWISPFEEGAAYFPYSEMDPKTAHRWTSLYDLQKSAAWNKVRSNKEYSICAFVIVEKHPEIAKGFLLGLIEEVLENRKAATHVSD